VAGSVALVGFGFDSFIEVVAAVVVLWQLGGVSEAKEQRALKLIGLSFFVLATYIVIESSRDLLTQAKPEQSAVGLVVAALSLIIMPLLAIAKRRTGRQLGNAALVAAA
jgi:divalent metal cation (Fe/Co/Zn/Cd) transporter